MITFTSGNMFDTPADIRINTVNCVGVMGAGLALAFKTKYPEMFLDYQKACKTGTVRPGKLHVWTTLMGDWIINFPTKRHWREPSRYEDIEAGLIALRRYLADKGKVKVLLPAVGCGHGGLEWPRISDMIKKNLADVEADIIVFTPEDSRAAGNKIQDQNDSLVQDKLDAEGIKTIEPGNDFFPKALQGKTAAKIYVKGDPQKLNSPLLAIFPSMKPMPEEINAAITVSDSIMRPGITLLIGYSAAIERPLIRSALEKGADVVIFLAEGILDFRVRKDLLDVWDENRITVVSAAKPSERWNPALAFRAKDIQLSLASVGIITDAEPLAISKMLYQKSSSNLPPIYYIDYGKTNAIISNTFSKIKAQKLSVGHLSEPSNYEAMLNILIKPSTATPATERQREEMNIPTREHRVAEPEPRYNDAPSMQAAKGNTYPKRLIEVDLPIKRISEHARREKSIRHGHISTLHIWWARRPLAACRAVICAALWPDPADPLCPDKFKNNARQFMMKWADQHLGLLTSSESINRFIQIQKNPDHLNDNLFLRQTLFDFIADFANWDNSAIEEYLKTSRALTQSAHESLGGNSGIKPLVVDPFAGGGSIPLEALRVGADAFASDLNPIPVLLNKVLLEYIPKYGQRLADEVLKWGASIKNEAENELANYYPKDHDGATPIAYLWARTIQCEGPGCGTKVPMIRSPWLSKRQSISLTIKVLPEKKKIVLGIRGGATDKNLQSGTVKRGSVTCPCCGFTTSRQQVEYQIKQRKVEPTLLAVVLESTGAGKKYRLPNVNDLDAIERAKISVKSKNIENWIPDEELPYLRSIFNVHVYGINKWCLLFDPRQKLALATLVRIVSKLPTKMEANDRNLTEAICVCLALAVDRLADFNSNIARWANHRETSAATFGRQALGMVWDYCETVPISNSTGSLSGSIDWVVRICESLAHAKLSPGYVDQVSAAMHPLPDDSASLLFTDPPYYDAVPYANLADFFYVWLKRSLRCVMPSLLKDRETPKNGEAVQLAERNPIYAYKTKEYFEHLMLESFIQARRYVQPSGIGVIVFAHKSTSAWETLLSAVVNAGWVITASWPIDTEMANRLRARDSASLASSVHLVCRPRENPDGSARMNDIGDWRDVLTELPRRIQEWMPRLAKEGVVGADAIFACLGPALEIFSRYSRVEKASGEQVTLKEYLEQVWAVVAKEALNMIFEGADTSGFEEDARLTAMWLWTLSTGAANGDDSASESEEEGEDEDKSPKVKLTGYTLEYDAARKIAQGLGAHLEHLQSLIEVKGDKARLLPVSERTKSLFGKDESESPSSHRKKKTAQLELGFIEEIEKVEQEGSWGQKNMPQLGNTRLDRLHQSMILFAAGRGEALKRFLVEEGVGQDQKFWRLAQALSALYPSISDEKRWVDGVLARKKGFGF
ncbi:MAG: DUF1156 domain-containing protein [Clostridia bacterium]|nr:DUF1156 domain-containing protein [Clostridia bacterium]